jgi:hypothetical protein
MEQPIRVAGPNLKAETPDTDGRVLLFLFLPMMAIAGAIFLGGGRELAIYLAVATFVISAFAAPEIGLYIFLAVQAIDLMALGHLSGAGGWIFTPGKIIAPFVLITYIVQPQRARAPMVLGKPIIICGALFGVCGLLAAAWSYFPDMTARAGAQVLVQALVLGVALHRFTDRKRIARAMTATFLGSAVAAYLLLTTRGTGSSVYARTTLGERVDPNMAALGVEFGIFAVAALWFCTRNWALRLVALAACPIMAMSIVLTGSRTALVLAVAVPIAAVAAMRGFQIRRFVVPAIALAVMVFGLQYGMSNLRMTSQTQERLGELVSGQVDIRQESRIWLAKNALSQWVNQPWGFGFQATAEHLRMQGQVAMTVHDNYISILVEGGPVAFALAMTMYVMVFFSLRNAGRNDLALPGMMMFMTVAISSLAFNTYPSKYFWVPMTLALVLAAQARREALATAPQPKQFLTREDLLRNLRQSDVVVLGAPT